eukprot:SAG31_NODE_157_length_22047_cov_5.897849_4_plen_48_part_00
MIEIPPRNCLSLSGAAGGANFDEQQSSMTTTFVEGTLASSSLPVQVE